MLQRALIFVAMMAPALASYASTCPSTNVISAPPVFQWTFHPASGGNPEPYYSGTLEYGEVALNIGGETLNTRAYRQEGGAYSIPGPTMNMQPGNKYVLRYKNLLPYEAPDPNMNVLKDANISNLHTHGLHISGESPGDDVTRFFEGGYGGDFVYDIPADHMGGTFWYHAHHHGSTFLQVSTGGFGLIVVDDSADGLPAEVAAMTEREMVIGFLDPDNQGASGDTIVSGTLGPTWTVNGAVNGNMCVPVNEWQHWRVLLADADSRAKDVAVNGQCEMQLLARDGVWRTTAPRAIANNTINLTGASRADIAVRCMGDATISVANTVVANVFADGTGDTTVGPFDNGEPWSATRPDYLRDLRDDVPDNTETVRMGARTINGSKFDHDVATFEVTPDGLQAWALNGARNHPFHLHVYHVQVDGGCGEFEDGEYYDVVAENCDLLFDLDTRTSTIYAGRTIMHCHILEHEDQGAMGWLKVLGSPDPGNIPEPIAAPTFPADTSISPPYSEYYALGGPPPTPPNDPSNLLATTVSSSEIDLSWTDNSNDESEFEIERSPGGAGNFANISSVGANVTMFSDAALSPDTAYDYRVRATNGAGNSGYSNTASATTDPETPGTSLTIASLVVTTDGVGQGFKVGRADVLVEDENGNAIEGALVTGDFSGTFTEPGISSSTDAGGLAVLTTSGSEKGRVNVTFCVNSITHPSYSSFTGPQCSSN
jgi:FtsP/CotA-like multicopper oxidase with cupredoxin domain